MRTILDLSNNGYYIVDAARLIRKIFGREVKNLGFSQPQWQTLGYLWRQEGINQARLAELLEVEPITLSRHVTTLENDGWVERRPDPHDRRVHRLYLTAKAGPVLAQMHAIRDKLLADAFAGIDEGTLEMVNGALSRIHQNLQAKER